jgi:dUTPase
MRFAKILTHARPPIKLNPLDAGITVFSAETYKLEFGEVHSFRTGIMVEIPEGSFGLLHESHSQGVKGVTVAGGLVTPRTVTELRVSLLNSHREAFEVTSGQPLAQLIILTEIEADDEAEETDRQELTEEMTKVTEEARVEESKTVAAQFAPQEPREPRKRTL